jgi:hypothetical protein
MDYDMHAVLLFCISVLTMINEHFQGQRSLNEDIQPVKRCEVQHFNLFHEELEGEDFAFPINVDELNN